MSDNRHRQWWTPADTGGRSVPGQACCGAGSPRGNLASGRRGRRFKSGHPDRKTAGHEAYRDLPFALHAPRCPVLGASWERVTDSAKSPRSPWTVTTASPAGLTARAKPEARPDRRDRRAANLGGESDYSIPVPPQAMHSPSRPRGRQTVQPWLYAGGSLWTSPVPSQYLHLPVPSQSLQAAMCVPPRKMVGSCE
jgi:hypothetical protein